MKSERPATAAGTAAVAWRRSHLWLGLLTAVAVIVVSLTGILLNHRETFGLSRDITLADPAAIEGARPINELLQTALREALVRGVPVRSSPRFVNRMMYRPADGTAEVWLRDPRTTGVILDAGTGEVLQIGPKDDITLEHLHSGELAGQRGVILTDIAGVALIVLTIGGLVLWRRRVRRGWSAEAASAFMRFNRGFHLGAGVAVALLAIALSVSGILLNHKRELGLMVEPQRLMEAEDVARLTPASLAQIASWARTSYGRDERIRFIDYRPLNGYAKARFADGRESEVIVDVYEGKVFSRARRWDRIIETIHSGAYFGDRWVYVTDVAAALLILLTVNGVYLWIWPSWGARGRAAAVVDAEER